MRLLREEAICEADGLDSFAVEHRPNLQMGFTTEKLKDWFGVVLVLGRVNDGLLSKLCFHVSQPRQQQAGENRSDPEDQQYEEVSRPICEHIRKPSVAFRLLLFLISLHHTVPRSRELMGQNAPPALESFDDFKSSKSTRCEYQRAVACGESRSWESQSPKGIKRE